MCKTTIEIMKSATPSHAIARRLTLLRKNRWKYGWKCKSRPAIYYKICRIVFISATSLLIYECSMSDCAFQFIAFSLFREDVLTKSISADLLSLLFSRVPLELVQSDLKSLIATSWWDFNGKFEFIFYELLMTKFSRFNSVVTYKICCILKLMYFESFATEHVKKSAS